MIYFKKKKPRKPCLIAAFLAAFLLVSNAYAQTVGQDLAGLGLKPEIADYIANNVVSGGAVLSNNAYFSGRNAANSANISMLKVDANDETIVNSDSGDGIHLQIGGDANRLISYTAASDTALIITFGDGGTTATQVLGITASTTDSDDDSQFYLAGGGSNGAARGGYINLKGNEASGGGDVEIFTGSASTSDLILALGASDSAMVIRDASSNTFVNFDQTAGSGGLRFASTYGLRFAAYVPTLAATPAAGTNDFKIGYNAVPTAAANAGALLPASPTQGDIYEIANTGPNSISVYPGSGDAINAGTANQRLVVPTLNTVRCIANSASLWYCSLNAAPTPQA